MCKTNGMQSKMVSLIECLWRQALQTFAKKNFTAVQSFEENFAKLKSSADKITAADVRLDSRLLDSTNQAVGRLKPPVTYIEIFEDNNITIGIFIIKAGMKIPLHDHPQMYGILKVLSGTVKIQSYNVLRDDFRCTDTFGLFHKDLIIAEKLPEVVVHETHDACMLTPTEKNLHEVESVNGPAAFLDILAPPYDSNGGVRICRYFKEVAKEESADTEYNDRNIITLFHIPSPPDFWSDSAPYRGPPLSFIG